MSYIMLKTKKKGDKKRQEGREGERREKTYCCQEK